MSFSHSPRVYANDPGEDTYPGWQRWTKTWCLDFISTYQIYWNVPDGPFDVSQAAQPRLRLPRAVRPNRRAGRRLQHQRRQPHARHRCPLCRAGRGAHRRPSPPLLPLAAAGPRRRHVAPPPRRKPQHRPRLVGLCASPRRNPLQLGLRSAQCALPCAGRRRPLAAPAILEGHAGLLLLRSALLLTVEAPEARYTLEFFPILFALAGIAVSSILSQIMPIRLPANQR